MRNCPQFAFVIHDHCQIFAIFFLILHSRLWNHVQSQQQKNKVRFDGSLRGGVAGASGGASSFEWFLGGFGWLLLVSGDFGDFEWFEVVCYFSSYPNFTTCKRVISLLYSWSHLIDWVNSIFIQSKTARKLVAQLSENKLLFSILYCDMYQIKNFFLKGMFRINSHKTQSK